MAQLMTCCLYSVSQLDLYGCVRRYVLEREGETAWTMHLNDDDYVPLEITEQVIQHEA